MCKHRVWIRIIRNNRPNYILGRVERMYDDDMAEVKIHMNGRPEMFQISAEDLRGYWIEHRLSTKQY